MEPSSTEGGAEETLLKNHPPSPPHKVILKHGQELEEEQEELAEHQPLEQEDLNFERWKRRPLPKRTLHQKIDDVKTYLWNAETNEFMGRSGKSWSLILLFYAALYLFLAAMFGGCMFCLMWSISPYHPTLNDRVMPPGMTMAPHLEGQDIAFNASDRKSWKKYARSMDEYLRPYNDGTQEKRNIRCTQDRYFMQDDLEESAERKACQFKRSWLGDCSGMQDPHYGYSQGRPCVLLRMNRKGPPEAVGELQFFPKSIFDLKYYPYYGKQRHVNYSSPVVAVRFAGVQYDTHIQVQCKLNGEGIINNSPTDRYQGSVTFSLEVGA
ncbi:hypothetical protein F2P81_008125 [Scophthalmus maximus]|uniref:Sodium/potassium-transporting ATPase subunit beta n=1 Tax=Scophthalmus maximus TaxID=52904 RepID=A0A6A4T7B7_SCOMX|nr:hypothetical protein F2P81_008125 [Scophthalmus maximus]